MTGWLPTDGAGLFDAVGEVTGLDAGSERGCWMIRNYERVVGLANSLFPELDSDFLEIGTFGFFP